MNSDYIDLMIEIILIQSLPINKSVKSQFRQQLQLQEPRQEIQRPSQAERAEGTQLSAPLLAGRCQVIRLALGETVVRL